MYVCVVRVQERQECMWSEQVRRKKRTSGMGDQVRQFVDRNCVRHWGVRRQGEEVRENKSGIA